MEISLVAADSGLKRPVSELCISRLSQRTGLVVR